MFRTHFRRCLTKLECSILPMEIVFEQVGDDKYKSNSPIYYTNPPLKKDDKFYYFDKSIKEIYVRTVVFNQKLIRCEPYQTHYPKENKVKQKIIDYGDAIIIPGNKFIEFSDKIKSSSEKILTYDKYIWLNLKTIFQTENNQKFISIKLHLPDIAKTSKETGTHFQNSVKKTYFYEHDLDSGYDYKKFTIYHPYKFIKRGDRVIMLTSLNETCLHYNYSDIIYRKELGL